MLRSHTVVQFSVKITLESITAAVRIMTQGQPLSGFGSSTGLPTHPTQPQRRVLIPFTGLLPCLSRCEIFARLRSNDLSMLAMPLLKVSYLVGLLFPTMLLRFSAAGSFISNTESFVLLAVLCVSPTQYLWHPYTGFCSNCRKFAFSACTPSFLPIIAVDDALHVRFVFSAPVVQYHYSRCLAAHHRSLQPEAVPGLQLWLADVSAAYYTGLCFSAGLYYDVPNNSGCKRLGKNSLNVNIYCFSFHVLYLPDRLRYPHSDCSFDFFQKVLRARLPLLQFYLLMLLGNSVSPNYNGLFMLYSLPCCAGILVPPDDMNSGTQILVCCKYCCASCSIDSGARDVPNAKALLVHEIIHDLFLYSSMNTQPNWNPQVILKACGSISAQFLHPISCQYTSPPRTLLLIGAFKCLHLWIQELLAPFLLVYLHSSS
ncbi:hypothetical protein Pelo_8017 [Pelomyxa schiedti]|nr:hypothetical protein Pelo_8017 [Pelomyxa schiedti]